MASVVDMNRGVMQCRHPLGFDIFMYVDDPGAYFDVHGNAIPAELAKVAGYPVELLAKKREFVKSQQLLVAESTRVTMAEIREVLLERPKGFKLIQVQEGQYFVENPQGNRMMTPNLLHVATALLDALDPAGPAEPTEEPLVFPAKT